MNVKTSSRKWMVGLSTVIALAASLCIGANVGAQGPEKQYAENGSGQSYGTLPTETVAGPDEFPDLVAVSGENGVEGYVRKTDLIGDRPEPRSPEEALAQNRSSRYIPVYEANGVTIIGRFFVGGADRRQPPEPQEAPSSERRGDQ